MSLCHPPPKKVSEVIFHAADCRKQLRTTPAWLHLLLLVDADVLVEEVVLLGSFSDLLTLKRWKVQFYDFCASPVFILTKLFRFIPLFLQ